MAVSRSGPAAPAAAAARPPAGPAASDAVGALRARFHALDASIAHAAQLADALADPDPAASAPSGASRAHLAPRPLPPRTASAHPAAFVVPALAPDGPVGVPLSAFPGQPPHPRNNPEGTRRIYPSYAAARAALAKQTAALTQEREQVRKLILDHASSALRSALGLAAGQGPGGDVDLNRTTEDGLPFVDPVERLPDGAATTDNNTPVSAWAKLHGGAATIAPFNPQDSDAGARRRFIDQVFAQAGDDDEEGEEENSPLPRADQQQQQQPHMAVAEAEARAQDAALPTAAPNTPAASESPLSPELRPLPHSADLPPPQKPALKHTSSYTASPAGTPIGFGPARAGSISMANLPGHSVHPMSIPDHDGLSWQPPPKAFGASGFKRGFLNLNPHSEGAKHSSDAVPGPSVWDREVETIHSRPTSPDKEGDCQGAPGTDHGAALVPEDAQGRGRSPSRSPSATGTKHVRIVSPSPSQRWHSHVWDERKAALSLGMQQQEQTLRDARHPEDLSRPLRNLKVSLPTDEDMERAKNMQVVLARPRAEPQPASVPDTSPLPQPPPTRMAKDEPDEDVTDEAAKIIALLGADSIAAQAGGVAVPGSSAAATPASDGAGGVALPRRPVAEPSAAPAPNTSARPALGRDVVERAPRKRMPPKRPARRTSASAPVPTQSAAQAHAAAVAQPTAPPPPPELSAPPADFDEHEPAVPPLTPAWHRVHPSPTPYPTPPVTGASTPVNETPSTSTFTSGNSSGGGGLPDFRSLPTTLSAPKPSKKRSLFGGFLKLNSAATSAAPISPPSPPPTASSAAPSPPASEQPGPKPELASRSDAKPRPKSPSAQCAAQVPPELVAKPVSRAESESTSGSEPKPEFKPGDNPNQDPVLALPVREEERAGVQSGMPSRETHATAPKADAAAADSASDDSASEATMSKRIREAGPRTSVGISALDRAVLAEEGTAAAVKPPHARPTKAYAAALARRRRSAEGTYEALSERSADDSEADAASASAATLATAANMTRRGSRVRFDLADEEYRASPPGSPGPSPARLGGKVRFASRASASDGSESDTVRRVRFAASNQAYRAPEHAGPPIPSVPVAGDDAVGRPPKIKRKAIVGTTPDGQPILRGRGQIRFTTSSDEAGSQSDKQSEEDRNATVPGRGKIRFAASSVDVEAHSGEDGYDTDPPPAEMVRRAHSGESAGGALRSARERAVSMTKAASSSSLVEEDTAERAGEDDVEGANESVGAAADDEQDLGSDEDGSDDDDDDPMLSEEEYTAADLASLMPSFDKEWGQRDGDGDGDGGSDGEGNGIGNGDSNSDDDDDDDDGDLDSALHLAEIQREYARIKSGILADRHRWTVSLAKDDYPIDPATGQAITTAPSSLVAAEAGSSANNGTGAENGKGKPSRFRQERMARAFAAHAAAEAGAPASAASLGQGAGLPEGLPQEGQAGKPIMVIPHLAPVHSTASGAPVRESDLSSARGVDLDGSSDDEDDRLMQMAKERLGLAAAPSDVGGASIVEIPETASLPAPAPQPPPPSAAAPMTEVGTVQERSSRPPTIGRARAGEQPMAPGAGAAGPEPAPEPAKRMSRFKAERLGLR